MINKQRHRTEKKIFVFGEEYALAFFRKTEKDVCVSKGHSIFFVFCAWHNFARLPASHWINWESVLSFQLQLFIKTKTSHRETCYYQSDYGCFRLLLIRSIWSSYWRKIQMDAWCDAQHLSSFWVLSNGMGVSGLPIKVNHSQ